MPENEQLLKKLYNAFQPFYPLPAGDPAYVDCREVRGDGDILIDLGRNIQYSEENTCQLYAGHRGAGKSTELLRLKKDLEDKGYFVVYFAADEQDINPEDTAYTDILLACTRHLLETLKDANPKPLLDWLGERWDDLKDLANTEISFDSLTPELQITQYAKLTANIRTQPSLRRQIRDKVDSHTTTLIQALNKFIDDGKNKLDSEDSQLVIIADNLDRIVPIPQNDGRKNHDEIFLDRSEQLKGLDCHVIYTIPISMVYSNRATDLRNTYDNPRVLPMIMVQTPEGDINEYGIKKVTELIRKRVAKIDKELSIETDIFESEEILNRLCLMSGGHVRELMLLMRDAIKRTDNLPLSRRVVQRVITEARTPFIRAVEQEQWELLVDVSRSKKIENALKYRDLLFNRCLLEYCFFNEEGERLTWYDVHPLLKGSQEFQNKELSQ